MAEYMDLYSKTKPELISDDILNNLKTNNICQNSKYETISDYIYYLYIEYLSPNIFVLFIMIAIGIFIMLNITLKNKLNESKKEDDYIT